LPSNSSTDPVPKRQDPLASGVSECAMPSFQHLRVSSRWLRLLDRLFSYRPAPFGGQTTALFKPSWALAGCFFLMGISPIGC
jgi:hypothetical protein